MGFNFVAMAIAFISSKNTNQNNSRWEHRNIAKNRPIVEENTEPVT